MKMKSFKPNCNLATIRDGRGAIFSFVPDAPILEFTHQFIKGGKIRGNHCTRSLTNTSCLWDGAGVEVEVDIKTGKESFIYMNKGECIYIPRKTYHVFLGHHRLPSVSFLTKRWDDCKHPIVHQNLGLGDGDHGDPKSAFNKFQNKDARHAK